MKVILYMAITANGFIAKENDDTSWISADEWNSYSVMVRKAGAMIIGRRTYEIITTQAEFEELKDVKVVIVSNNEFSVLSENHVIVDSPEEALEQLESFSEVILAGGGILNAAFMKLGLVDEMYVDIEPLVFGKGLPLFKGGDFAHNLELLDTKIISKNEIQLHYKILK